MGKRPRGEKTGVEEIGMEKMRGEKTGGRETGGKRPWEKDLATYLYINNTLDVSDEISFYAFQN